MISDALTNSGLGSQACECTSYAFRSIIFMLIYCLLNFLSSTTFSLICNHTMKKLYLSGLGNYKNTMLTGKNVRGSF